MAMYYLFSHALTSAAKLTAAGGTNASIDNLMLKTGLSRDQLSQLARDQSLSNLVMLLRGGGRGRDSDRRDQR